jgi:hypothetical protein
MLLTLVPALLPRTPSVDPAAANPFGIVPPGVDNITDVVGTHIHYVYIDRFPDYDCYLRASATPQQWERVKARLGPEWVRVERKDNSTRWDWGEVEPKPWWWRPGDGNADVLEMRRPNYFGAIKFEDGQIYYFSFKS